MKDTQLKICSVDFLGGCGRSGENSVIVENCKKAEGIVGIVRSVIFGRGLCCYYTTQLPPKGPCLNKGFNGPYSSRDPLLKAPV